MRDSVQRKLNLMLSDFKFSIQDLGSRLKLIFGFMKVLLTQSGMCRRRQKCRAPTDPRRQSVGHAYTFRLHKSRLCPDLPTKSQEDLNPCPCQYLWRKLERALWLTGKAYPVEVSG